MNEMADEAAAQHTLAANPLVGVSGHDMLDSARVLLGQIMRNPALVVQQSLGLLGELGRIATGESKLAPDTRDKRFADPAWKESTMWRALSQCEFVLWAAGYPFVEDAHMWRRD